MKVTSISIGFVNPTTNLPTSLLLTNKTLFWVVDVGVTYIREEFSIFKHETLDKEKLSFYPEEKARFDFLFNEYLTFGGLPEIVRARGEDKTNILQEYFRTVIRREIMERFGLKNEEPLKTVAKLLLNSTYFSLSKIHRDLVSQGVKIGKNTVNNYFSYLSSAYLFAPISHFSFSLRHQMTRPQKAFFADNGFITAFKNTPQFIAEMN